MRYSVGILALTSRRPVLCRVALPLVQLTRDFATGFRNQTFASGTIVLPSRNVSIPFNEEGALLAVVEVNTSALVESRMFYINDPMQTTAQAQIDAMAAYLTTSTVMNSSRFVVGVAATRSHRRRLLYEYNMHPSTSLEVNMFPRNGYYYMNSAPFRGAFNKTWTGAVNFCASLGTQLCDITDYVYQSTIWPTTGLMYTVHGQVDVRPAAAVADRVSWRRSRRRLLALGVIHVRYHSGSHRESPGSVVIVSSPRACLRPGSWLGTVPAAGRCRRGQQLGRRRQSVR